MVPISTSNSSNLSSSHYHHRRNSIYQSRHRLALSNEGPYFFRSLVWGIYRSGEYSDFTIRVKGSVREFHVHRAVICPQSEIFEAACRGRFIEASTNSMTLTDDDPEIVQYMIKYLYTHRYDDAEDWNYGCCDNGIKRIRQHYETTTGDEEEDEFRHALPLSDSAAVITTARNDNEGEEEEEEVEEGNRSTHYAPSEPPKSLYVYAIADKYLIYPLKNLARTRFSNWAYSHWWTRGFVSAAREIFDNETGNYNELKEVVLSTIVLHADTLLCGHGCSIGSNTTTTNNNKTTSGERKENDIQKFMQDYSEVSVEVLRRTLDRSRIRQRGLEVDVADLESRVNALRVENKKIGVLQSRNHSLNKELLEIRMVVLAWKRDLKNSTAAIGGGSSSTSSGAQDRRIR
ncbi:hypothetical protein UA08_03624 [Talaromyces atroroseus]|uniref:BTB domain-containing protein n=1 Tax=Talaromyces atroroseus TaxID=1441469 RepID=A0A225AHL5_TALAT|nr:hypothetical protein UA08_03624 [Talaromyces atroroseus]OKL60932.1 hypothetical protein UA08_03624 [Talaromyces atroroseus]